MGSPSSSSREILARLAATHLRLAGPAGPFAWLALLVAFSSPLTAGAGAWTPLGPPAGAAVALAGDPAVPGIVYAGMEGGLFRSLDGAASWVPATGLPPGPVSVTVDPLNTAHLYALQPNFGASSSFFSSGDRGVTWTAGGALPVGTAILAVAADPSHAGTVYAASYRTGLFRSVDGAASWQLQSAQLRITSLAVDGGGKLYAGKAGKESSFLESNDGGTTWVDKSDGLPRIGDDFGTVKVVLDPHAPGTLYLDAFRILSEPGNLFKSADGGESWSKLGPHGTPIAVAPDGTVYSGVQRSTDGGASWSGLAAFPLPFTDIIYSFAFDAASPATVYALTFISGAFVSHDRGASWLAASHGLIATTISALAVDPVDPAIVYASTQGNGFFRARASGRTWLQVDPHHTNVSQIVVDPGDPATLYTPFPLQKSADRGATWQTLVDPPCPIGIPLLALAPTVPTTLYLVGEEGGNGCSACNLVKSTDGGASWNCLATGSRLFIEDLAAAPSRPSTLYATNNRGLWKSGDAGAHWTRRPVPASGPRVLAVDPTNPDLVYVSTDTVFLASANGGRRWFQLGQSLPAAPISLQIDPRDPHSLYVWVAAASQNLLLHSADGGQTWTSIADQLPFFTGAFAIDLAHANTVFAATSLDGVQTYTVPGH